MTVDDLKDDDEEGITAMDLFPRGVRSAEGTRAEWGAPSVVAQWRASKVSTTDHIDPLTAEVLAGAPNGLLNVDPLLTDDEVAEWTARVAAVRALPRVVVNTRWWETGPTPLFTERPWTVRPGTAPTEDR